MEERSETSQPGSPGVGPPRETFGALFIRFLRFGLMAWGGPTAQIAMIREELVDRERWVDGARFNRVLGVYQALPGPEAHELCVYFGMLSRGRIGAVLAGLGFMLPGLALMLLCAWLYVATGLKQWWLGAAFAGMQPAAVALIGRGVVRIGWHALKTRPWSWLAAAGGAAGEVAGVPFWIGLVGGGAVGAAAAIDRRLLAAAAAAVWLGGAIAWWSESEHRHAVGAEAGSAAWKPSNGGCVFEHFDKPATERFIATGLKAGLLSFGGAYTAIPFVEAEAVGSKIDPRHSSGWVTHQQFLDGLAIGGILPAPMVIFGTFVGFLGGGVAGALLMTAGIFLPAFGFTLIGHRVFERIVDEPRVHGLLDGVTAAVVGIMGTTAARIAAHSLDGPLEAAIAVVAFVVLWRWRDRWATVVVVLGAGTIGIGAHMLRGW
ncbi:MAG: chromate efflux transporter [Phycisphaerales bacterium]|nr:chromate efflux transporter [Phycisphaerales bacterium]